MKPLMIGAATVAVLATVDMLSRWTPVTAAVQVCALLALLAGAMRLVAHEHE